MEYVRLGNTGMKVSQLCLGCMTYGSSKWRKWILDEKVSRPFFKQALEAGINFFDTADMYSLGASEQITGKALFARCDCRTGGEAFGRGYQDVGRALSAPCSDGPRLGFVEKPLHYPSSSLRGARNSQVH